MVGIFTVATDTHLDPDWVLSPPARGGSKPFDVA